MPLRSATGILGNGYRRGRLPRSPSRRTGVRAAPEYAPAPEFAPPPETYPTRRPSPATTSRAGRAGLGRRAGVGGRGDPLLAGLDRQRLRVRHPHRVAGDRAGRRGAAGDRRAAARPGGPRVLAFANPKGGVHKTTATVLAAATVGSVRGKGVLAWDDNELRGTLGLRAGSARHARTIRHLVRDLVDVEAQHRLRPARRGSTTTCGTRPTARTTCSPVRRTRGSRSGSTRTRCKRVLDLLRRTHDVICVDTGNNVESAELADRAAGGRPARGHHGAARGRGVHRRLDARPARRGRHGATWSSNAVTLLSCPTPNADAADRGPGRPTSRRAPAPSWWCRTTRLWRAGRSIELSGPAARPRSGLAAGGRRDDGPVRAIARSSRTARRSRQRDDRDAEDDQHPRRTSAVAAAGAVPRAVVDGRRERLTGVYTAGGLGVIGDLRRSRAWRGCPHTSAGWRPRESPARRVTAACRAWCARERRSALVEPMSGPRRLSCPAVSRPGSCRTRG